MFCTWGIAGAASLSVGGHGAVGRLARLPYSGSAAPWRLHSLGVRGRGGDRGRPEIRHL